jgi:hypothetical protein
MIVSLSILAAITAFIAVAFRLAGRSMTRGGEEAVGMARLRAATEVLERAIRSADPSAVLLSEGIPIPYFRGGSRRMRFLSAAAPSSVSGGGARLLCFHEADSPGKAPGLLLSEGSPLREEGVEDWEGTEKPRPLISDATEVSFGYSPGPKPEGKWEWAADWNIKERKALPAAVRVEFATPSEGGPRRTAVVIPVPAGGT